MMTREETILVLGLGNILLSDEAVGVCVVNALQDVPSVDDLGILLMDGGTMGMTLMVDIENADALIVLDAAQLGEEPGTIATFEGADMDQFLRRRGRSPHDIGLDDILDGLRLREALPQKRALVGIQPESLRVGEHLTPKVEAAVAVAVEKVLEIATRWRST